MLGAEVMQHAKAAVPVVGHQSAQQMAQLDVAALHEKAMVILLTVCTVVYIYRKLLAGA